MSPEQLNQLKKLSESFSEGNASHIQIRQLSLLLAEMNIAKDNHTMDEEVIENQISP